MSAGHNSAPELPGVRGAINQEKANYSGDCAGNAPKIQHNHRCRGCGAHFAQIKPWHSLCPACFHGSQAFVLMARALSHFRKGGML